MKFSKSATQHLGKIQIKDLECFEEFSDKDSEALVGGNDIVNGSFSLLNNTVPTTAAEIFKFGNNIIDEVPETTSPIYSIGLLG